MVQGGTVSKSRLDDSDDEMAGPDPYSGEVVLGEGNEAYRVYDDPAAVPAAEGATAMYNGNGARCATPGTANLPRLALFDWATLEDSDGKECGASSLPVWDWTVAVLPGNILIAPLNDWF